MVFGVGVGVGAGVGVGVGVSMTVKFGVGANAAWAGAWEEGWVRRRWFATASAALAASKCTRRESSTYAFRVRVCHDFATHSHARARLCCLLFGVLQHLGARVPYEFRAQTPVLYRTHHSGGLRAHTCATRLDAVRGPWIFLLP
eukprot:2912602-Pleurochrysis_carterae.AAC.2